VQTKIIGIYDMFKKVIILGNGYSAQLAAIALHPIIKDITIVSPKKDLAANPIDLRGQSAHSHIFLPRLQREFLNIDPEILQELSELGHKFVPGSNRLKQNVPMGCNRLFLTRWQFDLAINTIFNKRVNASYVKDKIVNMDKIDATQTLLAMDSGRLIKVDNTTLIIDGMGTNSPCILPFMKECKDVIEEKGNVVYLTQFFQLSSSSDISSLPDPIFDCAHNFGNAYIMLYPANDLWFTVTIAINDANKPLIKKLRNSDSFYNYCKESPHIKKWLKKSKMIGPNRIYINPKNRWNVPIFQNGIAPPNYIAIGDALTSMLPTLGANCSFTATHVRILRDLILSQKGLDQTIFAKQVKKEQFAFFQNALESKIQNGEFISYAQAPQNRLLKRLKKLIRKTIGLDIKRIKKHLIDTSSL
tara:strand:+ start:3727 stop:4974 length:1248 start_codon:yes stop_codon:yes gene_type:complete